MSSGEFLRAAARIWFQFVEMVIRNHIDERLLTRAYQREGTPLNLVVVSNRVSRGKPNEPMTGGLAAALLPIVEKSGAIWVGSSGRVRDGNLKEPFAEIEALGTGALAMLDLPAAHYGGYYEGFANSALWPALHSRADLIRATQEDYLSYREVNAFMARALLRFRKTERTHDGGVSGGIVANCREVGRDMGRFQRKGPRREPEGTFRRSRSTGYRCACDARSAGRALRRLL